MGEIEEYILWSYIYYFYLIGFAFSVLGWVFLGLYNVFGIPFSIFIFAVIFLGLPLFIYRYNEKRKSRSQQEMIQMEDSILKKHRWWKK
jgi:hypothetical protein